MAVAEVRPTGGFAPVAVVWCRQVDNEAESPGYTTIPEEFPGRRETLEAIRLVGNLTVNVADTHDYWDPDPAQTLSYYPNLFLYPAGNGRYTCVGRMFLSTEDRPRLGMKTLVLDTAQLVASGEFGPAALQAWTSMGGRGVDRVKEEPEPAVYQAVGEGFLFHRGTTEPVVVVAAEQWDSASRAVLELVRFLPTSLIALGAFLVFPYFLPEGKVNLHEFSEQIPLALALMRVPEREAQGERHAKRIQSWEASPVSLRDLTKPPPAKGKDPLPLVLQYVRDHNDDKITEVSRRVDIVEATRLRAHLEDADHQAGRDRRKEMWRIGTAMESAALLLARPKGRSIPMTGEAAKRANQYLQAHPTSDVLPAPVLDRAPTAIEAGVAPAASASAVPPWLQRPAEVQVPETAGPAAVPMSVSDDPSTLPAGVPPPAPVAAPPPPPAPSVSPASGAGLSLEAEVRLRSYIDKSVRDLETKIPPPTDPKGLESQLAALAVDIDVKSKQTLDRRLQEVADAQTRATAAVRQDLASRLAAVEARPVVQPVSVPEEVSRQLATSVEPRLTELAEKSRRSLKEGVDAAVAQMRTELARSMEESRVRATKSEEELRVALVAQMDLEIQEAKEHGSALREEIEGRIRDLLKERLSELDARHAKDVRELETRFALLVDGRAKDLEGRLSTLVGQETEKHRAAEQEQVAQVERRLGLAGEARIARAVETQTQNVAGLQVRLQSYIDQRLHEEQEREREKYVELLARFKTEVDQALARTIDSAGFESAVRERIAQALVTLRVADEQTLEKRVGDVATRLKGEQEQAAARLEAVEQRLAERETTISEVEQRVRTDLEELDRRLQVMTDRMVPLVRNTWLKVDELQKGGGPSAAADQRLKEFRREFSRDLRRLEGELLEQTTELRDRMESAIANQGRIWLNFMRQMAAADEDVDAPTSDAASRSLKRASRAAAATTAADPRLDPRSRTPYTSPYEEDPVNPLDPDLEGAEPSEPEPLNRRRSTRRSS